MSQSPSIIDPFHRNLHNVISEEIDKRKESLAIGSANDYTSYMKQVGYLEALNSVLERCREIEKDRYDPRPGASEQD